MSTLDTQRPTTRLDLPPALSSQLRRYRGAVWRTKLAEAVAAAACGILGGYLAVFCLDRVGETPAVVRWAAFVLAAVAAAAVPAAVERWIWRRRGLEQVARLVARRMPALGDQLLGAVELVHGQSPGRSQRLCEAALEQVAARAAGVDLEAAALPPARLRTWATVAAGAALVVAGLATAYPAAAANTLARFAQPWRDVARYTFTRLVGLPETLVVPHGEPAQLAIRLRDDSLARPGSATVRVARQPAVETTLGDDGYAFAIPPQLEPGPLRVRAGDARLAARLEPLHRPEITGLAAEITLPAYLERPGSLLQDVRGGTVSPVAGSAVALVATASRSLQTATVDGLPLAPSDATLRTPPRVVDEDSSVTLAWSDAHGLAGARPLVVSLSPRPDAAPTLLPDGLPANREMLLDTDTLRFTIAARDDFGIREVGLEWEGLGPDGGVVSRGERLLQAGGSDRDTLDVAATFCPADLGIAPQPVALMLYAEDYLPGRGRVRSPALLLYVVDRAEHALVINERLNRWRQQAGEVRDREMSLFTQNKELRDLDPEALETPATRDRIAAQAAAEQANARRLERLVGDGGRLVREALKNDEFDPQTLERLAEDIRTLSDIAAARMPSVADLLAQAARAEAAGQPGTPSDRPGTPADGGPPSEESPRVVGEDRSTPPKDGGTPSEEPAPPGAPQVVDRESSQQPTDPPAGDGSPSGPGRLGLPTTQAGVAPPGKGEKKKRPPGIKPMLDEAIESQEALLAEFAKVAEELAAVMARLEGSTFVKRFKLASREQGAIGSRLAGMTAEAFTVPERQPDAVQRALQDVVEFNSREAEKVSNLLDDLQAYFDRRRIPAFRTVLEEMKDLDALGSLRQLSDDIGREAGMSIAQSEFWSDTFDRLADDLVPPPEDGSGDSADGPKRSLPPEVVLEALQILEAEVTLREETRVAEQTRARVAQPEFAGRAAELAARQEGLAERVIGIMTRLMLAPQGEEQYGSELRLFGRVEEVMRETTDILRSPDTGPRAIAAESEVIELLLATQAAGGGGGGGGGSTPGGGGTGTATTSALALVGQGNTVRGGGVDGEESQATGAPGRVLPDEFRAGLDAYFNRFEKERP